MDAADHSGRSAGTASIRRVPAKSRDRAEGSRRPSSLAGRRRNPRAGSLSRTAGAVRVPPDPKGPRPSCRARRPPAKGRRLLQREAADARAHEERQEALDRRARPDACRDQAAAPGSRVLIARPAEHFQAECFLLLRFSSTASRMRFLSAPSLILSSSLMSMARLTFPSRLELNRPEGSFKAAPLKNVSLTAFL